MDENRELIKNSSSSILIKPSKFLNELKNKFINSKSSSSDISLINETNKNITTTKTSKNDLKLKTTSLTRTQPILSSKLKLISKTPSKEFLSLKNSIERQLKMPRLLSSHHNQPQLPKLDSLGSSAINTDHSANISLTSFSSSSLNNIPSNNNTIDSPTLKCMNMKNSKIPTRISSKLNESALRPKLIDLEFKNELERLFSGISNDGEEKRSRSETKAPKSSAHVKSSSSTEPKKRLSLFNSKSRDNSYSSKYEKSKQSSKCSSKLKDLFGVISGNLIVDYSDLLVDFRDDSLEDTLVDLESNSDEITAESASRQFSLLRSCDLSDEHLKGINNEKLIKFLVNIMVNSCRMYDAATMKTESKISYWRYANPIVAAFKSKSSKLSSQSATRMRKLNAKLTKTDSATQTTSLIPADLEESNNTSLGTELQNTVIEAKLFQKKIKKKDENLLTQSIVELISESLSFPKSQQQQISNNKLISNKDEHSTNQKESTTNKKNNKKIAKLNKNEIEDLDKKIKREEEILKQNCLDFNQLCHTKATPKIEKNDYSNNEDEYYYVDDDEEEEIDNDDDDDDDGEEDNRNIRETITNSSKSINKKRLINCGIRSSSKLNHANHHNHTNNLIDNKNGHYYHRRRSMRLNNSNKLLINNVNATTTTSKAQDETLRDAENISDIDDNELDMDQWDYCASDFLLNTTNSMNKMKLVAPSVDLNLNRNIVPIQQNDDDDDDDDDDNYDSKLNLTRTPIQIREEIVVEEEEVVGNLEENHNNLRDKQISSASLSISSTPLSLSLSSSSNNNNNSNTTSSCSNKCDALCMFNSTLNVCHLLKTNDLEPLAKLKSPKHRSVQVNLEEDREHIDNHYNISDRTEEKYTQIENLDKISEKTKKEVMEVSKKVKGRAQSTASTKSSKIGIVKKLERTHSLDSLENDDEFETKTHQQLSTISNKHIVIDAKNHSDFNVDLDINISRIETVVQQQQQQQQQIEQTKQELSEIPEIKIDFEYQIKKSLSPNLSEEIVKKRARESLKFWKEEEEKKRKLHQLQHESSSSLNNSYSILSTATSSSVSQTTNNKAEPSKSPSITIKRVKDRINVFETIKDGKNQTATGTRQSREKKPIQLVPTNDDSPAPPIQSIQSRIKTFEDSISSKKSTSPCEITFKDYHSPQASSKKLTSSKSLDCELDSQSSCIKIPIILTTRVNSSSNYSIKNISCQIDKKKSCNQSLGNLASEDATLNEPEIEEEEEEEDDGYDNYEDEHVISDHHDKSATSQTSFLSSNLVIENSGNQPLTQTKIRNDSEEMEEVEIIISLDNITQNTTNLKQIEPLKDEIFLDERLKNIVMHMIPTTRKSYIDDIVTGIKELIDDQTELNKIGSPLDLPKHAVKFIHKRYSSLLTESNSISALGTDVHEIHDTSAKTTTTTTTTTNEVINLDTTTEVTVVKEFRMPTQSESNPNSDEIVKVEEETLYIVEKRRPIPISKQSNEVDKEIRKNFELKSKEQTFDECSSNLKQYFATSALIDELKKSILDKTDDINDYQMHFYDMHHHVLVMLFDKFNNDNYRFNLEKKYHKSIIDTHVTNKKNDINIVAHLNVYCVNEEMSKTSQEQFDLLSLIRPPTTSDDIASITNNKMFNSLPIGKYFVDIKYQQILLNNDLEHKQSLIDLSLLPLPIRIQLIYELETNCNTTDLPTIELLIQDSNLFKTKLIKSKENIIKDVFRKYAVNMDDSMKYIILNNINNLGLLKAELSTDDLATNYELDNLIKNLESELNSFYICYANSNKSDLAKINCINALVSFDSAQKFKELILPVIKHNISINNDYDTRSKVSNEPNCFYHLDGGKFYKCCVPFSDLVEKASYDSKTVMDNSEFSSISVIDPYTQSRATYILKSDLTHAIQINDLIIRNVQFKQLVHEFQMSLDKLNEDDENLPSLSESISDAQRVHIATQDEEKFKRDFLFNLTQQIQSEYQMNSTAEGEEMLKNEQSFETLRPEAEFIHQTQEQQQEPEPTQFETDRLKLDLHLNNIASCNAKQLRDKIIISEIDKMFTSIRDHQGATAKAKDEELVQLYQSKKKKGCTWSYSSNKRHVRAKIMELPIAEDINQIAKTIGINDLVVNETYDEDDSVEKVFVRIDDYLNKEVSRTMQRSYSADYLNQFAAGNRTRIRYIKIPGQTIRTQSMMSCSYANPVYNIPPTAAAGIDCTNGSTEYRTAPYDLRYWSILKLLEEERNSDGQLLNYLDDQDWTTKQEPIPIDKLLSPGQKIDTNIGDINYNDCVITSLDIDKDLEKFLSMNDLDKEIERVKNERIYHRGSDDFTKTTTSMSSSTTTSSASASTPPTAATNRKPQYIIKEKMLAKKPELIEPVMERIDAELSKLEQSGLIEKIDLQSIEYVNKYTNNNDSAYQSSNQYEYASKVSNDYDYQTSSIIPQSYSVQNNGQGLEVPQSARNTITTKLQDLVIYTCNSTNFAR